MYYSVARMLVSTLFTLAVAGIAVLAPMTGNEAFFLSLFAFFWFFMVEVFFAALDMAASEETYRIFELLLTSGQLLAVTCFAIVVQILL